MTDAEFREHLGALLRRADQNGVDVTGGYAFRDEHSGHPDWGVEIHEVRTAGQVEDGEP